MIHKVLAVFDKKMEAFARPFHVPTLGMGVRSFMDEVKREADDNQMWKHPEDYSLWVLCDFDEELGVFQLTEKRLLLEAGEVK